MGKYLDIDRSKSFFLKPSFYRADIEKPFYYGFFLWFSFWLWNWPVVTFQYASKSSFAWKPYKAKDFRNIRYIKWGYLILWHGTNLELLADDT
jgi:hypothetical protein